MDKLSKEGLDAAITQYCQSTAPADPEQYKHWQAPEFAQIAKVIYRYAKGFKPPQ